MADDLGFVPETAEAALGFVPEPPEGKFAALMRYANIIPGTTRTLVARTAGMGKDAEKNNRGLYMNPGSQYMDLPPMPMTSPEEYDRQDAALKLALQGKAPPAKELFGVDPVTGFVADATMDPTFPVLGAGVRGVKYLARGGKAAAQAAGDATSFIGKGLQGLGRKWYGKVLSPLDEKAIVKGMEKPSEILWNDGFKSTTGKLAEKVNTKVDDLDSLADVIVARAEGELPSTATKAQIAEHYAKFGEPGMQQAGRSLIPYKKVAKTGERVLDDAERINPMSEEAGFLQGKIARLGDKAPSSMEEGSELLRAMKQAGSKGPVEREMNYAIRKAVRKEQERIIKANSGGASAGKFTQANQQMGSLIDALPMAEAISKKGSVLLDPIGKAATAGGFLFGGPLGAAKGYLIRRALQFPGGVTAGTYGGRGLYRLGQLPALDQAVGQSVLHGAKPWEE